MTPDLDPAAIDAAIAWSIRLNYADPTPADLAAFEHWREARPEHGEAWRRIAAVGARFEGVAPVIALGTLQRGGVRQARRRLLKSVILLAGAGSAAWYGRRSAPWERLAADYATGKGETRTVKLDDGTLLQLNTDTALDVHYSATRRLLDLRRGEIYVATGADAGPTHRPFLVRTEFGTLRALGTRFFVRLADRSGRLAVTEGAVEIQPLDGERLVGQAGTTYRFDAHAATRADETLLDAASWRDGLLVVRDMPLAQFLAELARYRPGLLTCDPAVAQLPVSGAYQAFNTDQTLQLVAHHLHLDLIYRTRYWVTLAQAKNSGA